MMDHIILGYIFSREVWGILFAKLPPCLRSFRLDDLVLVWEEKKDGLVD
jgi:hypothetical protein